MLHGTNRLDAIKKKLKKYGYEFTESGKGKEYKITIIAEPNAASRFVIYCIETLKFSA